MKRNLNLIQFIFLSVVLVTLLFSIYVFRDLLIELPFNDNQEYNISSVTSDSQDNTYLILEAREKIVKIDSQGVLQYEIKREEGAEKSFNLFTDIAVDDHGYLYAINTTLDYRGVFVESEKILRYMPTGTFDRVLYQVEYKEDQRPSRTGNIKALQTKNGLLHFFLINNEQIFLNTLSTSGKDIKTHIIAYLPADTYLSEISGLEAGSIVYSTLRGEIYRIDHSGSSILEYPQESQNIAAEKTLPASIRIDENQVYFVDIIGNEIRRFDLDEPSLVETVFSQEKLDEQGNNISLTVLKNFNLTHNEGLQVVLNESVISMGEDGQIKQVVDEVIYPATKIAFRYLLWAEVLLLLGVFIYLCRLFYINVMNRRISLIVKQIVVFIPIFVVSMVFVSGMVYTNFSRELEEEVFQKLLIINNMGQKIIDVHSLEKISQPRDFKNDDYQALEESLTSMLGAGIDEEKEMYNTVYKLEDGNLFVIIDDDNASNIYTPIDIKTDEDFQQVLKGKTICSQSSDEDGSWMYSMGPLYNWQHNIIGIYENGMDMSAFSEDKQNVFKDTGKNIVLITIILISIFLIVTYYLLLSIRVLRDGVNEMASGHWGIPVDIRSRDEVGDLGQRFNIMSTYIRNYLSEITELSESYFRFVPQQFLKLLGKESILDVHLGDQVEQEMNILVMNIRSFYVLSEKMKPQENFNFINAFFKRFGPVIRNNGGMVDQYMGGGIRALFSNGAEEALKAAIEMRSVLEVYNRHRSNCGYEALNIGIGVHRGALMLGVIGEEERAEGTVISDNVNLAAVLEKLTEKFGATILITEDVINAINKPGRYYYRRLGKVRVEGKDESLQLYDVFQGDSEEIKRVKLETQSLFEKGVALFQDGNFYSARANFIEVIRQNREDEIAKIYFYLCEDYYKNGIPDDWNGTLSV